MFAGQLFVPNVGKKMLDRKQFLKTMYAATFYSGEINCLALSARGFVCLYYLETFFIKQIGQCLKSICTDGYILDKYCLTDGYILIKVLAVNIQNLFL